MPGQAARKRIVRQVRRIVVKVGTHAICDASGRIDLPAVRTLAKQIAAVRKKKVAVTLVASGAIAAGLGELELLRRPKTLPKLQAVAAVGQGQLMRTFHDIFARYGVKVAQVLLTREDFEDRTRYLNIRNTLAALEECDALAIVNENDTVAVDEICFGENDILAAMVTNMQRADLLVLLTNVDGVIKDGKVLDVIEKVDRQALSLAEACRSPFGSGGMASKLAAAGLVIQAGEVAVIAKATESHVLLRLLAGETLGTVFVPAERKLSSRRRWIGQASRPAGKISIDSGAVEALQRRGRSLLPSGVTGVSGQFGKGAVVAVTDAAGRQVARGLTNYSAEQLGKIKGLKTGQITKVLGDKPYDEVIHRNNLTLGGSS